MVDEYTHRPDWPIAVYAAVEGSIPFAPFVAYPMVPTVGKKGERGLEIMVRCTGKTISEAKAKAEAWIDAEIAKSRSKTENLKAGVEKRRASRAEAE